MLKMDGELWLMALFSAVMLFIVLVLLGAI